VDWKRLVQFALLGSSDLEQYAILLVRVSLGLFFAISGANKLLVADSRETTKLSAMPKRTFAA
jgi:putative oxidoreductase